jgi:hypothetical protein
MNSNESVGSEGIKINLSYKQTHKAFKAFELHYFHELDCILSIPFQKENIRAVGPRRSFLRQDPGKQKGKTDLIPSSAFSFSNRPLVDRWFQINTTNRVHFLLAASRSLTLCSRYLSGVAGMGPDPTARFRSVRTNERSHISSITKAL